MFIVREEVPTLRDCLSIECTTQRFNILTMFCYYWNRKGKGGRGREGREGGRGGRAGRRLQH